MNRRILAAALLLPCVAAAQDNVSSACGNPFRNHFGPFDYRSATPENKNLVERVHFTPGVESMTKPSNTTFAGMAQDVGYTLHVFPNHHRALITMTRLGERHKSDKPPGAGYTVECYYDRAVRFAPDDTVARALYAQFLVKRDRKPEALQQLAVAAEKAQDRPLSQYNVGLVYLEIAEFELALEQAHKARRLGLENRPQLEEALRKVGKWRDPEQ